jgi:hypothetical protein
MEKKSRKQINITNTKPILIIPQEVINNIAHICNKINDSEWSAVLFYDVIAGSIDNAKDLKLQIKHFWPMKKGSSASVEFDFDDKWIEVYDKYPNLEDCKRGIFHSHANMGVFHSGTDYNDLATNCGLYDFYLSLVVNNRIQFDCKIAVPATEKKFVKSHYSYRNSFGQIIDNLNPKEQEVEEDIMFIYDVEVQTPIVSTEDTSFSNRVLEVIKDAEPKYNYQTELFNDYRYGRAYNYFNEGNYANHKETPVRTAPINNIKKEIPRTIDMPDLSDVDDLGILSWPEGVKLLEKTLIDIAFISGNSKNIDLVNVLDNYIKINSKYNEPKQIEQISLFVDTFVKNITENTDNDLEMTWIFLEGLSTLLDCYEDLNDTSISGFLNNFLTKLEVELDKIA